MARPHYNDLDAETQAKISRAMRDFLRDGGHSNLEEAMETLAMGAQELWSMIVIEAGLPDHEFPLCIEVGRYQ